VTPVEPSACVAPPPDLPVRPAAELHGVGVRYGAVWALQNVTATFPRGASGLLGANGAGKSTMIKALLGLVVPDRGAMTVLGASVGDAPVVARARVGYMPEVDAHIPGMNAVSCVAYCAELAGLPRADAMQRAHEVLYYVGLGDARYRMVDTYSTGMRQRIKLAQALVHDPDLLLLDEPTNGMDPKGRSDMLELIRDISHRKELDLIVASHLLPDVDYTCDHVVVLDRGRVAAQGPIAGLKAHGRRVFELRVKGDPDASGRFIETLRSAGTECHMTDDAMRVFMPEALSTRMLFELASQQGLQIRHLRPSVPTLEDVFADAIGGE